MSEPQSFGGEPWWQNPIGFLLARLAPSISVTVRPGLVTFLGEGRRLQLPPRMYLEAGVVRGVGYPPHGGGALEEVDVLDVSRNKMDPLSKFLAHGFRHVLGRSTSLRPVVRIDLLVECASDKDCWVAAAMAAKAARVEFSAGDRTAGTP